MLQDALLAGLNHLLAGEDWARDRLASFAGQTVRLEFAPLHCSLEITAEGYFRNRDGDAPATVAISLSGASPLRLLGSLANPSSLLASARISGSAGLADCIGFVFRNLRWDVESDLANMIGDIAAHRLLRTGRHLVEWHQKAGWNLARNLAEYFTEERQAIASKRDVAGFCLDVATVNGALSRLEERFAALENAGNRRSKQ